MSIKPETSSKIFRHCRINHRINCRVRVAYIFGAHMYWSVDLNAEYCDWVPVVHFIQKGHHPEWTPAEDKCGNKSHYTDCHHPKPVFYSTSLTLFHTVDSVRHDYTHRRPRYGLTQSKLWQWSLCQIWPSERRWSSTTWQNWSEPCDKSLFDCMGSLGFKS